MKKRTRTFLFFAFVALFIAITPPIVLYAQGYRIDFQQKSIVKTGAIFVQARPYPVELTVDGIKKKRTSFLFRNIFIPNLLPRTYTLDIRKDGYNSWHKELPVQAGLVTETSHVTLYPLTPKANKVSSLVLGFFPAPDGESAIVTISDPKNSTENLGIYTSTTVEPDIITPLLYGEKIKDVVWSYDRDKVLLVLERKYAGLLRLLVGSSIAPRNFSFISIPATAQFLSLIQKNDARWQWSNDNSLLYFAVGATVAKSSNPRNVYSIDLVKKELRGPIIKNIYDFLVLPEGITVIENTGLLVKYTHFFGGRNEILTEPFAEANAKTRLQKEYGQILIQNKGNIYLLDNNEKFVLVDEGVNSVVVSPDQKKLALVKDTSIVLYWLENILTTPSHSKGEKQEIAQTKEKIISASWLSSPFQYLAYNTKSGLFITETDPRDSQNIVTYQDFASQLPISWNSKAKSLLVFSLGSLWEINLEEPQ